ncbi:HlyD family type I secretion periplasmic adaptor subunit [Hyphomicrobium sp.]|uniref:HlyD family type I secretion periplasmic adaptor subunit n=1 Tax=Hyphomicrobium sp. TaxID=82 RepID=UPI002E342EA2|nr:HlyD family type I secretion periplasmic adaptor subunit [Hyphomicrobium sp.]HEX2840442.1 HlyD family type I secretion periplasmic adaptor subunit [Hyphomicrobium sp.]
MNALTVISGDQGKALIEAPDWSPAAETPSLSEYVGRPARTGYALIFLFVFGFGAWAATAPLAGGAVAPGIVSPTSNRKTVQHLEGGIVRELKVREGETVAAGQPLIVLDPIQSSATYEALMGQRQSLLARSARLDAEKSGAEKLQFPSELQVDGHLSAVAASQQQIFLSRRATHQARKNVLAKKVEQLNEQVAGLTAQAESTQTQLGFIREEAAGKIALVNKGLLAKPEALRLQREESALVGRHSEYMSEIGRVRQQIAETELQSLSLDAERLDEVTAESDKVRLDLADLGERLRASADVLKRTVITAPTGGTVINMRAKTLGGVVQRGESILEIVPTDDALIIDAHVYPNDINRVHPGLVAQIHLSAYSSRVLPRIEGRVKSVSPDRVTDPSGQQAYYLARVEVDREKLKKDAPNVELIPGMAAEIVIVAEERTLLQYLWQPIEAALRRGMHES